MAPRHRLVFGGSEGSAGRARPTLSTRADLELLRQVQSGDHSLALVAGVHIADGAAQPGEAAQRLPGATEHGLEVDDTKAALHPPSARSLGTLGGFKSAMAGILIGGGGTIAATEGKELRLDFGTVLWVRFDEPVQVEP